MGGFWGVGLFPGRVLKGVLLLLDHRTRSSIRKTIPLIFPEARCFFSFFILRSVVISGPIFPSRATGLRTRAEHGFFPFFLIICFSPGCSECDGLSDLE